MARTGTAHIEIEIDASQLEAGLARTRKAVSRLRNVARDTGRELAVFAEGLEGLAADLERAGIGLRLEEDNHGAEGAKE